MFHVESWFYKKRLCKELINYLNANKKSDTQKGVPYKGFFETLKIYRKLHFQAVKSKLELRYSI